MAKYIYPTELADSTAYPAYMQFNFFHRDTAKNSQPGDEIQLYMPESFQNPNTVSWDSAEFGFVGNLAHNLIRGAATGGPGLNLESFKQVAGDAGAKILSGAAMNIAAFAANQAGGNVNAEDLGSASMGKIPNPYQTQIFKGVNFRNFQYTFHFVPHKESDCDLIHNIIKSFRKASLPTGDAGGQSAFLGYPDEVEIKYCWQEGENKFVHRFKRSVIKELNIDYTGTGTWTMMRNGFPAETKMDIAFTEIEIIVRNQVDEGY